MSFYSTPERPLEPPVDWKFEAELKRQDAEFDMGKFDALRDAALNGIHYAERQIMDPEDPDDPYVEGYLMGIRIWKQREGVK